MGSSLRETVMSEVFFLIHKHGGMIESLHSSYSRELETYVVFLYMGTDPDTQRDISPFLSYADTPEEVSKIKDIVEETLNIIREGCS